MIIRVPATSANLGPGFDCMGIAWDLYNRISFEPSDKLEITGCDSRFQNSDNLAYTSYLTALRECGVNEDFLKITFTDTGIPVSRGLGSSAALISAGIAAADELHSLGLGKEGICRIACSIEGHPDNVAPAVFGNLQIASMKDERVFHMTSAVNGHWKFLAIIPDFELSTIEARKALPSSYSRQEAVFNISRTALLVRALESGDAELLRYSQDDLIHQPYRFPLIKGSDEAVKIAYSFGAVSVCISGAGPTILCTFLDRVPQEPLAEAFAEKYPSWRCVPLAADSTGIAFE